MAARFGLAPLTLQPFGAAPQPKPQPNPLSMDQQRLMAMFQPLDAQQGQIDEENALLQALRGPTPRRSTAVGGAFSALASGVNGLNAGIRQNENRKASEILLGKKAAQDADKFSLTQALAAQAAAKKEALEREKMAFKAKQAAAAQAQAEKTWRQHNAITSGQADKRAAVMSGQKIEQKQREGMVPGLEFEEGAIPTADDAKKMKASMASANRLNSYVDEVAKLHSEHGTELTGPSAARMGQLMTAIRLESKNIAELGALSGPDMDLMNTLTGSDPSSFAANLKGMFGSDNTAVALDGLKRWTKDTIDANKKAFGYRDAKAAASANGLQLDEEFTPDEEAAYQQYKKEAGFQ